MGFSDGCIYTRHKEVEHGVDTHIYLHFLYENMILEQSVNKESIRNTKEHKPWTSRLNQLKTSPEPKSYLNTLQDCCLPVQQDNRKGRLHKFQWSTSHKEAHKQSVCLRLSIFSPYHQRPFYYSLSTSPKKWPSAHLPKSTPRFFPLENVFANTNMCPDGHHDIHTY